MRTARHIRSLEGYVPGEQPRSKDVVKLNTNENPYPPSPRCAEILSSFDLDRLRRYPDPVCGALAAAIARRHGVKPSNVCVGNGSDEILALAARAFVEDGESIASLDPSYSLYKTLAAIRNVPWTGVRDPLSPDSAAKLSAASASLFLWTNPNAPTGVFADPAAIARFAALFPGVVLVDEAYAEFADGDSIADAASGSNENMIVMRTFSKSYSLAGLRVGYCIGPEELVSALVKIKDSYNVDALAQAVALAAFEDEEYHAATIAKVRRSRAALARALRERGWDAPESASNFLFAAPPPPLDAAALFSELRERGVFVRYFPGPATGDRLRITVGTDGQNERFLAALDEVSARPGNV